MWYLLLNRGTRRRRYNLLIPFLSIHALDVHISLFICVQTFFVCFSGCLVVKQIYNFIVQHFPFFDINEKSGWKNSIRHTLIQKKFFDKAKEEAPNVQPVFKTNSNGNKAQ